MVLPVGFFFFFFLSQAECNLHPPASFNRLKDDISRSHCAGLNSSFLFSLEMRRQKMSRAYSRFACDIKRIAIWFLGCSRLAA